MTTDDEHDNYCPTCGAGPYRVCFEVTYRHYFPETYAVPTHEARH